jgi:hypothetical protein
LNQRDSKGILGLLGTLLMSRLLFILLMPATYSIDLHSWLHVIEVMGAGENPYATTHVLNWPPFWMLALKAIGATSAATHLSAIHLIQGALILGECVMATVCYQMLQKFFAIERPNFLLIPVLALNPIPIFQVCQHANFDVFVGIWVVLMVYALLLLYQRGEPRYWLMACLCVGMGIFTKTIPIVLVQLLLPAFVTQRNSIRIAGILLALAPVALSMGLLYLAAPAGVRENVLGYRSLPGYYGITGIMGLLGKNDMMIWYLNQSPWIILTYLILITALIWKNRQMTPSLIVTVTLALLVFLPTFGPGYSPTYIYWYLPLLPICYASATKPLRIFLLTGLVIVSLTYVYEYAIFGSHGAFLLQMVKDPAFHDRAEQLGGRMSQVPARMAMFVWYVVLNVWLVAEIVKFRRAAHKIPTPSGNFPLG